MNDRDHDSESRDPSADEPTEKPASEEGAGADQAPSGPAPATWAGRQRGSSEDAGEHDQVADGEAEAEGTAGEEPGDEETGAEDQMAEAEETESEGSDDEEPEVDQDEDQAPASGDTAERLSQDTVEANTLTLGDREAAREAALQGLRARAAEHASKTGTEAVTAPPPKTSEPSKSETDGEGPPAEAPPAPVTPAEEFDNAPPKGGVWVRFAVGSLLVITAMATATALSGFFFVNGLVDKLGGLKGVQNELVVADPGAPQTILILGSDKRPEDSAIGEIGARSDTTILLRIATDQITVLSIPRDLRVNITGLGPDKFNAAYTAGGVPLTVKTVKQLTGITEINHVVNVNFTGFADAVNSIGCVYVDVDHHYYHSNVGLAPEAQYAEIDIPAGYQRMCGYNALQYVRFRHDDNDLVRSARQQEFLREMRQELPAERIANDYTDLVDILNKYVTLDIQKGTDLINLATLILSASNAPVVQVDFPANLGGPTAAYVTASEPAIKEAVAKFEGVTPTPIPSESSEGSGSGGDSGGGGGSGSGGSGSESSSEAPAPSPLIDSTATAQETAANLAAVETKGGKPMLDFPVYYPTMLAPDSTILLTSTDGIEQSRAFPIDGPGDEEYRGYKIVVSVPTDGYTGYYGVSGTDWKDPPILENPDETRTLDGQDYLLSWDGPQLRLIGWKTDQGTYWISNTLLNVLTPGQMFGIAESMQKYTG
jgi:LCP family protein required for cell wall assembly